MKTSNLAFSPSVSWKEISRIIRFDLKINFHAPCHLFEIFILRKTGNVSLETLYSFCNSPIPTDRKHFLLKLSRTVPHCEKFDCKLTSIEINLEKSAGHTHFSSSCLTKFNENIKFSLLNISRLERNFENH